MSPDWTSSNDEWGGHPDKISKGKSQKDVSVIPLHESNPTAPHNLTVAQ